MIRCLGCMKELREIVDVCPYCNYKVGEGVKEAYYLIQGTILNKKYIVGKVLGYGGFGVTYVGWDTVLDRKVAIKEYFPSDFSTRVSGEKKLTAYSGDKEVQFQMGLDSFVTEARKLAKFTDIDEIVDVYDYFLENNTGYIVMEFLYGHTVRELLKGNKTFSSETAIRIIKSVLHGLEAVHREGIIHRDITPENIFITQQNEVRLLDFGAARYANTHSRSLSVILKPGYAPEEQYRSKGEQGPWTDVYGVGASFYRMVTGRKPQESLERMIDDQLKPPSELGIEIPKSVENALMSALGVRKKDRIQSVEEFRQFLERGTVKKVRTSPVPSAKTKPIHTSKEKYIWRKTLLPVAIGCIIISAAAITFVLYSNRAEEPIVVAQDSSRVPNLCGKPREEAEEKLQELGMEIEVVDVIYSELSQDYIVVQDPEAGYTVGEDKIVRVTLSGSTEEVMLPRLKGKKKKGAIKEIKTRNLNLNEEEIQRFYTTGNESKDFPKGYVLALLKDGQPVSEEEDKEMPVVKQGSQVSLKISLGDYDTEVPDLDVPDLSGKTMDEATNALGELKQLEGNKNQITFALVRDELEDEYSKEVSAGYIIRQIGATSGEKVKPLNQDNSRVEIRVILSKGPRQIVVPDVKGMTKEEAIAELENAGFQVNINNAYSSVESGAAAYTSPAGDTEADEGSVITLYVSVGSKPQPQQSTQTGGWNSGGAGNSGSFGSEDGAIMFGNEK